MPLNDIGNGDVVDGVYLDSSQLFSVVVPDDWEVVSGSQFGELRVTMEHSIHNYSVQIWQLKGTHYRPTVREDCVWSFIDKGLYTDWSMSRPTNVATCVSNDPNEELVFLFLRHWKGYTWYLEGHVDVDVLLKVNDHKRGDPVYSVDRRRIKPKINSPANNAILGVPLC